MDVSGFPDQEKIRSFFLKYTSSEHLSFVKFVCEVIPFFSSAIFIIGYPSSEKFILLKASPFFQFA